MEIETYNEIKADDAQVNTFVKGEDEFPSTDCANAEPTVPKDNEKEEENSPIETEVSIPNYKIYRCLS
jgi:hypothetical protein